MLEGWRVTVDQVGAGSRFDQGDLVMVPVSFRADLAVMGSSDPGGGCGNEKSTRPLWVRCWDGGGYGRRKVASWDIRPIIADFSRDACIMIDQFGIFFEIFFADLAGLGHFGCRSCLLAVRRIGFFHASKKKC